MRSEFQFQHARLQTSNREVRRAAAEALGALGDFLLNLTPVPLGGDAPVIMIVEARREDVERGLGPCPAELVAVQRVNAARGHAIPVVYGAVTTGFNWRFVTLSEHNVVMDLRDYSLAEVDHFVGILIQMVAWASTAAAPGSAIPAGKIVPVHADSEREPAPEGAGAP